MMVCWTRGSGRRPSGRRLVAAAASCAALGLVLASAPPGRGAAPSVGLVEKEFVVLPRDLTVSAGEVTFVVRNQGAIEHNLVVEAPGGKAVARIEIMEPGEDRRFTASLAPGLYTIYCSLPGHRDAGMAGTLRVKPSE